VTFVTISTVKGAPGGTTVALLLARALASGAAAGDPSARVPSGSRVLLVECDPAGGDLAPRLGLRAVPGLASLALASRHGVTRSLLFEHSQLAAALPGVRLLAGIAGPEQGAALSWIFAGLAEELSSQDLVAVVDTGRIRSSDEAVAPFLRCAATTILVVADSLPSLVHARAAVDMARAGGLELVLVIAGPRQHSITEISRAVEAEVIGAVGFDRAALAGLLHPSSASGRWRGHAGGRNPLLGDAARLAAAVLRLGPPARIAGPQS